MEQDYAAVCKEGDLVMGEKYNYSSSLIMISMKPKPGSLRIINCLTLDELMRSLSQNFFRHGPIEIARVNERNMMSPELRPQYIHYTNAEEKEIRNFRQTQVSNPFTWIYRLPILQETYVDSSIMDCINARKNSIELVNPVSVMLYQSQGRSGLHDEYRSVYSAVPISRCEMLSNPDNCNETSTFEEKDIRNKEEEIIESVPELDAETLRLLEEQKAKNNMLLMNRRKGQVITTTEGDYKTPIRVQTRYDNDGNVAVIERFESDTVDMYHHDEKIPSHEAFDKGKKDRRWIRGIKNIINPFYHRLTGPAIILEEDGVITLTQWYKENKLSKQNGPAVSIFYKDSGRPMSESFYINGIKTENTVGYFNKEKSPIINIYSDINGRSDFKMYYAPSDEVIQNTNLEKALFPGQQLFIEKVEDIINIFCKNNHTPIVIQIDDYRTYVSWNINEFFERKILIENNLTTTMISNNGKLSKSLSNLPNRKVVSRYYYPGQTDIIKVEKHWQITEKGLVLDNFPLLKQENYSKSVAVGVFNYDKTPRELLSYNLGALQEVKEMPVEKMLFIGLPIISYNEGKHSFKIFNYEEKNYPYRRAELPAIILNETCKKVIDSDTGATLNIECETKENIPVLDKLRPNMKAIRERDIMDKKWIANELKLQFRLRDFINAWKNMDYFKTLKIPELFLKIDEIFIDRITGDYSEYDKNLYEED